MPEVSRIFFAGGGSLGHIAPSVAVWQALREMDPRAQALFVRSHRQEEQELLDRWNLPSVAIHAGKFPRGLSMRWLTFPVLFPLSLIEAVRILRTHRCSAIFSKGGYVSVPVCIAGWLLRIPIVLHESDSVTGLGNRMIHRWAVNVCLGFPPSSRPAFSDSSRTVYTGNPVRPEIRTGSADAGRRITGFSGRKPVILIIGGSQGAQAINDFVEEHLDALLEIADVIHLTGKGKRTTHTHARYFAREFLTDELPHLYALASVVLTRAGAGTLSELAALSKPAIMVPLAGVAHDHQVRNAEAIAQAGAGIHVPQTQLATLTNMLRALLANPQRMRDLGTALHRFFPDDAATRIATVLLAVVRADNN